MPAKQSYRALAPIVLGAFAAGAVAEIDLPLDEVITAVFLHVEGTYTLGGAGTLHEDGLPNIFSRIEWRHTGAVIFDGSGFEADVIANHEWEGGDASLAPVLTAGAGRVWRNVLPLNAYMPHVRNPFISAVDPRGYSEHKLRLTSNGVANVFTAGAPAALSLTVTPVVAVLSESPALQGRVAQRREEVIGTAAGATERTIGLKSEGVMDRILVVSRVAAGTRTDALITQMRLVVNGQERRIDGVPHYPMRAIASRSQGEVLPVGVAILELDPDDYMDPANLIDASNPTSCNLILNTTNADDAIRVLPRYLLRSKVA